LDEADRKESGEKEGNEEATKQIYPQRPQIEKAAFWPLSFFVLISSINKYIA